MDSPLPWIAVGLMASGILIYWITGQDPPLKEDPMAYGVAAGCFLSGVLVFLVAIVLAIVGFARL